MTVKIVENCKIRRFECIFLQNMTFYLRISKKCSTFAAVFVGKTDKICQKHIGKTDKISQKYIGKTDKIINMLCLIDTLTA